MTNPILVNRPTDLMPYGKYKNKTVQFVIETDPEYANWMIWNMVGVKFHQDIRTALRQFEFMAK